MKKRIILIMGDLAAGKSTYAEHISNKLHIPCFLKDTFKEILSDTIGYSDRLSNRKLSSGAFYSMLYIAKRLMALEYSFILESNFRQEELDEYHRLVTQYHYDSLILWLQGDPKLLHERYLLRIKDGRHQTHLVIDLKEYEQFLAYTIANRERKLFGQVRIINADNFDYFDDDTLFS